MTSYSDTILSWHPRCRSIRISLYLITPKISNSYQYTFCVDNVPEKILYLLNSNTASCNLRVRCSSIHLRHHRLSRQFHMIHPQSPSNSGSEHRSETTASQLQENRTFYILNIFKKLPTWERTLPPCLASERSSQLIISPFFIYRGDFQMLEEEETCTLLRVHAKHGNSCM